jgi:hypothetical protein
MARTASGAGGALVARVCSQLDPFCEHAVGAGRYDINATPSTRITCRQEVAFVTGTSGGKLLEFSTVPDAFLRTVDVDATGAQLGTWSPYGGLTQFTSGGIFVGAVYRVVCAGIRIINTTSYLNSTGRMRVISSPQVCPTTGNVYGRQTQDAQTYPFVGGLEVHALHRQYGAKTDNYYPVHHTTDTTTTTNYLQVWLVGAGDAATFTVEVFYHYELILDPTVSGGIAQIAQRAAPPVPRIMQAAAVAGSNAPASVPGPVSNISRMLRDAAARGLGAIVQGGLTAIGNRLAGPAGGAALPALGAYVMEVD